MGKRAMKPAPKRRSAATPAIPAHSLTIGKRAMKPAKAVAIQATLHKFAGFKTPSPKKRRSITSPPAVTAGDVAGSNLSDCPSAGAAGDIAGGNLSDWSDGADDGSAATEPIDLSAARRTAAAASAFVGQAEEPTPSSPPSDVAPDSPGSAMIRASTLQLASGPRAGPAAHPQPVGGDGEGPAAAADADVAPAGPAGGDGDDPAAVADADMLSPTPRRLATAVADEHLMETLCLSAPPARPAAPSSPTESALFGSPFSDAKPAGASIARSNHPQSPLHRAPRLASPSSSSGGNAPPPPVPDPACTPWVEPRSRGSRWQGKRAVRFMSEAMAWPDHVLDRLAEEYSVKNPAEEAGLLSDVYDKFGNDTISCAFSGIDAPGVAIGELSNALQSRLQQFFPRLVIDRVHPLVMHHVEWFHESQQELLIMPGSNACIYDDIECFFKPQMRPLIDYLHEHPDRIMGLLAPLVTTNLSVTPTARCLRHGKSCRMQATKVHFAGTPCPDWSDAGSHRGTASVSMIHFLAWVGLCRLLQHPVIVQENVEKFPVSLLQELLGDLYRIETTVEDSEHYGFPVTRVRRWTILLNKKKILSTDVPFSDFMCRFHRACQFAWEAFFRADIEEIKAELIAAASRKSSRCRRLGLTPELLDPNASESFELALTGWECDNMNSYRTSRPYCMYSLYQSHSAGFGARSTEKTMHTLIKNTGMY
ncbi:unnamed protein product [Prorocentrum cordatum]|uniref:Poly(ADP-ribose) glycohydrolase n=1 Tax=Prorocentrum cordatum TaxID=2364126 RepID=A0ABN9PJ74_9DINO|nr:unnamed protein product [Polarella glacialis]